MTEVATPISIESTPPTIIQPELPAPVEVAPIQVDTPLVEGASTAVKGEEIAAADKVEAVKGPKRSPLGELKNFFSSKSAPTSPVKETPTDVKAVTVVADETPKENVAVAESEAPSAPVAEESAVKDAATPKKGLLTQLKSFLEPKPKKTTIPAEETSVVADSAPVLPAVETSPASEVAPVIEAEAVKEPEEAVASTSAAEEAAASGVKFDAATKEAAPVKEKMDLVKLGRRLSAKVFAKKDKRDLASAIESGSPVAIESPLVAAEAVSAEVPKAEEVEQEAAKVEEPVATVVEAPKVEEAVAHEPVVEESKVEETAAAKEEAKDEGAKVSEIVA